MAWTILCGNTASSSGRVSNMSTCIDHLPQPLDCKVSTISSVSHQQALLQAVVATITLSCALIFSISESDHANAVWDENETDKMMEYLWDHVASAGNGGNFKDSTYQAAATYIAPYHKSGPIKMANHVKGQYKSVSTSLIQHFCFTNTNIIFVGKTFLPTHYQLSWQNIWNALGSQYWGQYNNGCWWGSI